MTNYHLRLNIYLILKSEIEKKKLGSMPAFILVDYEHMCSQSKGQCPFPIFV